jgi:hypothetical protein
VPDVVMSLRRIDNRFRIVLDWFVNLKVDASSRSAPAGQPFKTLGVTSRTLPLAGRLRLPVEPATVMVINPELTLVVVEVICWLPALMVFNGTSVPE